MKTRILVWLFFLLSISLKGLAQQKTDIIVKRSGEKVLGTVRQLSDKEVFYGEETMPANVFRTLPLADVAAIIYADGKVQTFDAPAPALPPPSLQSPQPISNPQAEYARGIADGDVYYSKHKAAATGTIVTTILINPIAGLIPAIACASTRPKEYNLGIPPSNLPITPSYMQGYKEAAYKKKKRKVWTNFGIGCAVYLPLYLLLAAQ